MNTLVLDLQTLIFNYFTVVDDVFINNLDCQKSKNIKVAVRINDWRSILYFLHRYEYQKFILKQLYYGACQAGNTQLMNRIEIDENTKNNGLKYLAKGRHYQLIDQYPASIRRQYSEKIVEGIVAAGDIDKIPLYIVKGSLLVDVCYKVGKHNRGLDVLRMLKDDEYIPTIYYIGQIKRHLGISRKDLVWVFDEGRNRKKILSVWEYTMKYQNLDNIIDNLLGEEGSTLLTYWSKILILLNMLDKFDVVVKLVEKKLSNDQWILSIAMSEIVYTSVRMDNLGLFLKYSDVAHLNTSISIGFECSSIKILQHIFSGNMLKRFWYHSNRGVSMYDPRIARMFVAYLNENNIYISDIKLIIECVKDNGFDVVANILSNLLDKE